MTMKKLFALLTTLCLLFTAALAETASPVLDMDTLAKYYNAALNSAVAELEGAGSLNSLKVGFFELYNAGGEYYDETFENITLLPSETEDSALVMSIRFIDVQLIEHEAEIPVQAFARAVDYLEGDNVFSEWLAAGLESGSVCEGAGFSIEYTAIMEEEANVGVIFTVRPL